MKLVLATVVEDKLGGVFAQAYQQAGGPLPHTIFVLAPRKELSYPWWATGLVAYKLLGLKGTFRVATARMAGLPFLSDKGLGLHRDWLATMAGPDTRFFRCRSINDPEALAALNDIGPDVLVSVGAPYVFKRAVLEVPRIAAINVHNGRLPKYRGHFGTFWEVYHGEPWAYTSIHEMVAKVDAGRLLATARFDVRETPSFLDLMLEKKRQGGQLLAQLLREIDALGNLPPAVSPTQPGAEAGGYFGWPSLRQILAFRYGDTKRAVSRSGNA